jgi:predicted porin
MRKLLMASAAILGATGGLAMAQTPAPANPTQGQYAGPYGAGPAANNNNNSWGIANTPTGSPAAGPLSTIYAPNVDAVPAPGTIVIRLNGRVQANFSANFTTADKSINAAGGYSGYKVNPVGISSYARIYPAFDGLAANGLRYGASLEVRENFTSGTYPGQLTGSSAAASTLTTTPTGAATSPSSNSSGETLFVRRAFTYIASDNIGLFRFGQGDGVIGLFDNCIFTSQCWDAGSGNFNGGDIQSTSVQAALGIPFVWLSQAGAEYANNKAVYLSPQFFGFDFGIQYAPSQGSAYQDAGAGVGCTQAGPTCINVTTGTDPTRWYNQVGGGLRFQQTFGAIDFKAYGFYGHAANEDVPENAAGVLVAGLRPLATRTTANIKYDPLSYYKAGIAVTTFNLTFAADYIGGELGSSGQLALKPVGGANLNAIVAGVTYANGPITFGAEYGQVNGQGAAQLAGVSQRREYEIAFGGSYKVAPGLQLFAEYMYEHRHQGDYNFQTGAIGTGVANDVQANSFIVGSALTW